MSTNPTSDQARWAGELQRSLESALENAIRLQAAHFDDKYRTGMNTRVQQYSEIAHNITRVIDEL